MGLTLLGTVFSLLIAAANRADAAAGDIGDVCGASSTCTESTKAVCDKVYGKCLIKAEQSCQGQNKDNCISGASCVTDQCTCGAGYTTDSNKLCNPKTQGTVGTSCTSGSNCKTPNSECSSLGACKCKSGFLSNITNGQCEGAVGTDCTAEDTCVASTICDAAAAKCLIKHGLSCVGNTDKCVSHATCPGGVCQCDASATVASPDGVCSLKNRASASATFSVWMLFVALMVVSSTAI